MRLLLAAALVLAPYRRQPLEAQTANQCDPNSEYTLVLEVEIANLRISLFHISILVKELGDRGNHEDLARVTKDAVYSLANDFSQRGDWFRKCSMTPKGYRQISGESTAFQIGLKSIDKLDDAGIIDSLRWPYPSIPPYVGNEVPNPDLRGRMLPYHLVAIKALLEFVKGNATDVTDPILVAALELLGEKVEWNEKKFVPTPFFKVNPRHPLAQDSSTTDKLGSTWQEKLRTMGDYYVIPKQ